MDQDTRQVIDAMPVPVVLIGGDERIIHANAAADELFGRHVGGRHYLMAIRQPALLDCIETALRQRDTVKTEITATRHGRDVRYEATGAPIDFDGKPAVTLILEDISSMMSARQIRRDFVANVSHELRTPLTALSGYIETLDGPARNDEVARARFLASMRRETERMNRLIGDLLSLSSVEGEERLQPEGRADLNELAAAAVSRLIPLARQHDVDLEAIPFDGPAIVRGDPDLLAQVLANLVENAIKYGANPGRVRLVVMDADQNPMLSGPALSLNVVDEGEGIEAEHIPRLTERFYRIDNHRSREKGGTGLGLAIVKHIVNRHRGRMRITSAPGQGTTVRVLLPRAARDDETTD